MLLSPEDQETNSTGLIEASDLNLLASLPQAPIPQHEFVTLTNCYVEPPPTTTVAPSIEDQDLVKDHNGGSGGVYSPEYISL